MIPWYAVVACAICAAARTALARCTGDGPLAVSRAMKTISLCLLLVLTHAACAQPVEDGLYVLTGDESAPSVPSADGTRLFLGQAQELAIAGSRIHSEDNANSQFWVSVSVAPDSNIDPASLVLVVSNRGYRWSGSGRGPDALLVDFRVSGADNARAVSDYLSTPIRYRRHPDHQLLVAYAPTKERYRVGDEVFVGLTIENIGSTPIAFFKGGSYRGSTRDNQYDFSARLSGSQVPDIGTNLHFGGIGVTRTLAPGEKFRDAVSLSKWFAFDRPGRYEVHGFYRLQLVEADDVGSGPLWTDYASGDFVVHIDD